MASPPHNTVIKEKVHSYGWLKQKDGDRPSGTRATSTKEENPGLQSTAENHMTDTKQPGLIQQPRKTYTHN